MITLESLSTFGHELTEIDVSSLEWLNSGTYIKCQKCDYIFCLLDGAEHSSEIWFNNDLAYGWKLYNNFLYTCDELIIKDVIK